MGATPRKAVTSRFSQPGGNRTSEAPRVVFDPTPNLVSYPLILSEYKARQRPSSGHLDAVSSVKERNRKGGKCKIS